MFKMKKFLIVAFVVLSQAASAQTLVEKAAKDELVFMRNEDPAMRRAFDVARSTLDDFLVIANERSPGKADFAVKVAISEGMKTEYFWVVDFVRKGGDQFEGEIGNEPRMVKTVKLGQRYGFPRDRIVDWTYIDKVQRRMVGNFTLCALLTQEPKKDGDDMKRRFNLDCSRVTP